MVDILDNININFLDASELLADKIFCVKCSEEKKDCVFVCEKHLAIVLLAKRKFVCTQSENAETATVKYDVDKKEIYCKGCTIQYLRLMFNYFHFVDFEQSS